MIMCVSFRVRICLKILYSNFPFIHHEAEVVYDLHCKKLLYKLKICVAKCLKCGAFCSAIQLNSHPNFLVPIDYCDE